MCVFSYFPSPVPFFNRVSCSARVQMTTFAFLYPVSACLCAQIGYRSLFSFSCTRFPSDFRLSSGTDHSFPSPVPGFRLSLRSDRVQMNTFPLLYPVFVRLRAQVGYRSLFFFSCTRFSSKLPLRKGTDGHFCLPVPFPPILCIPAGCLRMMPPFQTISSRTCWILGCS